ncbi:MAG: carbamate kinase, partial [Calditrichia bacterium]
IVAETEGGMGYMISQCLQNLMYDRNIKKQVVAIVTQVEVDKNDASMKDPTKFVGPFFKEEEVSRLVEERGWIVKEDPGRGWRRVVPSPKPLNIIEKDIIKKLLENEFIIIAGGGGGIPVYIEANGWLEGIDGVIDKDLSSAVLAKDIAAKELLILTGVEKVALNFGKPDQKELDRMTLDEAKRYLAEGHFPPGSMGPKIEASINFLEYGGERVIITSIEKSVDAMSGKAGTIITAV